MEEDPVKKIEELLGTTDSEVICQTFDDLLEKDESDEDIWRNYIEYLKASSNQNILKAYSKYCKEFFNDTFSWQDYIFHLEKYGKEWVQLEKVFNEAIQFVEDEVSAMGLYRTIIYAKLRYVRVIAKLEQTEPDYLSVKKYFDDGDKYLLENFGVNDPIYKRNYAYFAFTCLNDVELGRRLWKEILASGIGNTAKWWIEGAEMERRFGSIEGARRILYRGINSVFEEPVELFNYFIQFEREEGTFDQVSQALKRVNDQAIRIEQRNASKKNQLNDEKKNKKRKTSDSQENMQSSKRSKGSEIVIKDKDGFVVPPIPLRSPLRDGSSSPSNTSLPASLKLENSTSPKQNLESQHQEESNDNGDKTIFLSNLEFEITERHIKEFLPNASSIRLVQKRGTNFSKGYAYVDFDTVEEAESALKKDRSTIKGRPVFVSKYEPHEKGEKAAFKYSTEVERNKLFVKSLPYKCGNKELKVSFSLFKFKDQNTCIYQFLGCVYTIW